MRLEFLHRRPDRFAQFQKRREIDIPAASGLTDQPTIKGRAAASTCAFDIGLSKAPFQARTPPTDVGRVAGFHRMDAQRRRQQLTAAGSFGA